MSGSKIFEERLWDITVEKCENLDNSEYDENGVIVNITLENNEKKIEIKSALLHPMVNELNINRLKNSQPVAFGSAYILTYGKPTKLSIYNKISDSASIDPNYQCWLSISYVNGDEYISLLSSSMINEKLNDNDCKDLLTQLNDML